VPPSMKFGKIDGIPNGQTPGTDSRRHVLAAFEIDEVIDE